jgi:site-specific DNA recombinase
MKEIAAYCRSAREEQRSPSSAFRQASASRRYATRHGFRVGRMYVDPGVSGITLERPALRKLLADCKAGKISAVIVRDKERLSRDAGQLLAILDQFEKCSVRLMFSTEAGRGGFEFEKAVWGAMSDFMEHRDQASE